MRRSGETNGSLLIKQCSKKTIKQVKSVSKTSLQHSHTADVLQMDPKPSSKWPTQKRKKQNKTTTESKRRHFIPSFSVFSRQLRSRTVITTACVFTIFVVGCFTFTLLLTCCKWTPSQAQNGQLKRGKKKKKTTTESKHRHFIPSFSRSISHQVCLRADLEGPCP